MINSLLARFLPAFALRWLRRRRAERTKLRLALRDFKFHDSLNRGD